MLKNHKLKSLFDGLTEFGRFTAAMAFEINALNKKRPDLQGIWLMMRKIR